MERLLEATYRVEQDHFWFRGFRRFVRPLIEHAVAGVPNAALLDAGCGTGANLDMLARYGTASGFDLTFLGLRYARQRGPARVAQATMLKIPFRSDAFHLVTAFDVMVCFDQGQVREALAEVRRVLRPGGHLLINTAALPMLHGRHSLVSQEAHRYRRGELRQVVERAGFHVERVTYTNTFLFPIVMAVRLAQRAAGLPSPEEAGTDLSMPSKPVNTIFAAALALEAQALRWMNMPVGSSLMCLARKTADGPAEAGRHD